jgi:peroxiredoxin
MLENEYLELVDQLKVKFDDLEAQDKKRTQLLNETRKKLCSAYGAIRLLDELTETTEVPVVMGFLIGSNRRILSEILFADFELYDEE